MPLKNAVAHLWLKPTMIEGIGIGFGFGVLFCYLATWREKQDLIDRITWHDPADFLLMKYNREQAEKSKPSFNWLPLKPLRKKEIPIPQNETQIANKISALEGKEKLIADYLAKKQAIEEERQIKTEGEVAQELAMTGIPRA